MAANTDQFKKLVRRWVGQIGAAGVIDGVTTTIPLNSGTNLPTDTAIELVIDRVNTDGDETASTEETIIGVVSGDNVISCVRGVEGTAQAHAAGAIVEAIFTASGYNDLVDALLVEHNQDGTQKALPASIITSGTIATARLGSGAVSATKFLRMDQTWAVPDTAASDPVPKRCRVFKSSSQSIPHNTDTTLTWESETYDTDTMHDTVSNDSRITATTAGVYLIKAQVAYAANATGGRQCHFKVNGTDSLAYIQVGNFGAGDRTTVQVSTLAVLSAGHYVEVVAAQNTGGALNIEGAATDSYYASHFEVVRLGSGT